MKKVLQKTADVLGWIFGYGIMISLFVGGLSFLGYLVALVVGGETAGTICDLIYKTIYPKLVLGTSIIVLVGLVSMYLKGQSALSAGKNKKNKS